MASPHRLDKQMRVNVQGCDLVWGFEGAALLEVMETLLEPA